MAQGGSGLSVTETAACGRIVPACDGEIMEQAHYIVVGAGSAGCALCYKLTENPNVSVLLIEAGGRDTDPAIHLPRGFGKILMGSNLLWTIPVTKSTQANETWVRGKVLGGSSSVNGMIYVRGFPQNYDALNLDGWRWTDIGPCFKAMETRNNSEVITGNGPLRISAHPERSPLTEAIIAAAGQVDTPRLDDLGTATGEGIGYVERTIWGGRRSSAATAFLDPIRSRPNLRVLTETEVLRVVFDGRRAIGVEVRDMSGQHVLKASGDIILCAGGLHSPKLLLLSGIGPAHHLAALGIKVILDAPDVGRNLQEHRTLSLQFRVSHGSQNHELRGARLIGNVLRYAAFGTGPVTHAAYEIHGFLKTRPDLNRPDGRISVGRVSVKRDGYKMAVESEPGVSCTINALRPQSRGTLMISANDPDAPLVIDPKYLDHEDDQRASIDVVRFARKLFAQPALEPFRPTEIGVSTEARSDADILALYHQNGYSGQHAVATCRMGDDDQSVVDTSLRVRGVKGLRVADLSVMPCLVASNTNGLAMVIGWRASELIQNR